MLAVDVAHFARLGLKENFERALEVAASVAVWLEQEGGAMGIVCSGALAGGRPAIVPLSRSSRQLSEVLEVLGRLQLKPAGTLQECCGMASNFPGGKCSLLCPEIDDTAAGTRAFSVNADPSNLCCHRKKAPLMRI